MNTILVPILDTYWITLATGFWVVFVILLLAKFEDKDL
jgi:Mg2+ and Co2+ transporter CorA